MFNGSNAGNRRSSMESDLFNQMALFSASGLVMSMALLIVGGVQILYPWI